MASKKYVNRIAIKPLLADSTRSLENPKDTFEEIRNTPLKMPHQLCSDLPSKDIDFSFAATSSNTYPKKRKLLEALNKTPHIGTSSLASGMNQNDHRTPFETTCDLPSASTPKRLKLPSRSSPKVNQSVKPNKKTSTVPKYQQSKIAHFFAPVKTNSNTEKGESSRLPNAATENVEIVKKDIVCLDESSDDLLTMDTSVKPENPMSKEDNLPKVEESHSKTSTISCDMENNNNRSSSRPILAPKFSKWLPYLTEYNALDEVLRCLNTNKGLSRTLIDLIAGSSKEMDECIAQPAELTLNVKRKLQSTFRMLVRVRFGKGLVFKSSNSKYWQTPTCTLKENCLNLFHHQYMDEPFKEKTQIELGKYTFSKRGDSWTCMDCLKVKAILDKGKTKLNGHQYVNSPIGRFTMNRRTNELEDTSKDDRKVDPDMPGGRHHICSNMEEFRENLKQEKDYASLKQSRVFSAKKWNALEKEIDLLNRSIDESTISEKLKLLLQKYNNIFKFDKSHRRFFVYFITTTDSRDILYFGLTSDPNHRLFDHKRKHVFAEERKNGIKLKMYLLPLGRINFMMASELEAILIRLSKANALNIGKGPIKNIKLGRFCSIPSLTEDIVHSPDNRSYFDLVASMNELIQHTFDFGLSINSDDIKSSQRQSLIQSKKRFHKIAKKLRDEIMKSKKPISKKSLTMSSGLEAIIAKWKNVFQFSDYHQKYYLYFFTYDNEIDVLYYGISSDINRRWEEHCNHEPSLMYKLCNSNKNVRMHVVPLGDMNIMLASELETLFIRLSKEGFLNDGHCVLNAHDGSYLSCYSFNEETVDSESGLDFENLILCLNELIDMTLNQSDSLP